MSISLRRLNSLAITVRVARLLALLLLLLAGTFERAQAAGITLVQHIGKDAGTTTTSALAFTSANTAGNFIAVSIRGGLSSSQVFTVTDSNGNTYKQAGQIGYTGSAVTSAIYYAENVKAGANSVTVSMTVSGPLRFDILEYSGVATSSSLDVKATATGSSTAPNSGNLTTTASGDLLLASIASTNSQTYTAGTGYTIRDFVPVEPGTKLITEDQVQTTAGSASAGASISSSDAWGVVLAAFKPAGGVAGVPATITATAGTPQSATVSTAFATQLQATVKDSLSNPVSGATVTFAAPGSGASGTFAGGVTTATTNASGVATAAVFSANATAGTYTVTASVSGVATAANYSLTNLAGAAASITATAGTPQSATVNTAFATQLQATVKDASNNPVSGVTVTFAAPGSGASGTFAGGVNTATTNASGVATAAVFTANTTAGAYTVTATVSGVATAANYSLTNLAGAAASITASAGTPQSATVNTAFATQLQATVKDASNNPVSGVTVTFAAPGSGASGTFAGGVKTATTNASGVATAAVFTANTTAGAYTVTASVSGVATAANYSLTNVAGAAASISATAGTPQSASINTAFATQLQAAVKDSFGNGVSGVTVTFAAPGSGASGTFAGGVNTATTNASGVAIAAVFTANATAGAYTVTASATGVTGSANFSLTNLGNPPANIAATGGTPQSATINTAFGAQLQVTVTDSGNNPVSGVTVTFAAPGSGASGAFAGGVSTAVTNASGVATSAVFTANSTAGSYTVTASVSGVATAANFSLTNVAGAAASIAATAGTPQSATVNVAFVTQLQATVKDSGGNPVSGVTVTFAAPGSGASGTFAGGANTATTNASGVATSAFFTANSVAGSYTVTASVSGVASPANYSLTNVAGAAASITATAGTPQSATVNAAFATQLQATVKDSFSNPVSGAVVTFAAPGSGASGAFAGGVTTATTNASGVATAAVFTANGTTGSYTVTASVSGVATAANFSLTNTAAPPASITATAGTPQSATVNTAFTTAFQATVKDASNNPVSGVTVTFAAPGSGASGTFAGGVTTATTNSLGVATAAAFTANSVAGSYTVTASVSGVATAANYSLTNLAGAANSISATAGTPQSATVNTAFATQLQATIKDASNNPVSGVTVTFVAPGSGASGTFAGGVNTATTNASGIATAAVFTANGTTGSYIVTASVSGISTPASFSLTNTASVAVPIALVQHTSKDAGTATTSTLAFVSANTAGNFIAVSIRGGLSSSQVLTVSDSNSNTYKQAKQLGFTGSAVTTAIYYAENIKGGANTITVTMSVSGPLRFAIAEYSGVAASSSLDGAVAATSSSSSPNSGNLTTTANGDLLLGNISSTNSQTFTAGAGYTIRDFVPVEPSTKLITEDQVQTTVGSVSASASLSASDAWGAILAAFKPATGGGGAGVPASIAATAGTPQSATVNTAFGTQLQATVKDSLNNPVSGVTVTFAAPGSGASGSFAGGVTTATTNASGVATAAVFTANTTAGAYTVTASVSGVAATANYSLTNVAGAANSITATAGTPQSATINTAFTTALQATVKDASNNPVSGVTVTFAAPGSGASGTFAGGVTTATTNASGVATAVAFTANGTTGSYTVTASVSGVVATANFSLTNVSAPPASITATAGTPQSATVNTAFTTAFQATVKDASNNPVSGVTVTFAAPGSGASGTFAGGVTTATTNSLGVATAAAFTANAIAGGPYNVTASVSGVSTPASFSLTNLAGPAANITATAGTPQSATVNTAFAAQLQATVTDSLNNPVSGVTVTFTAPASGASGTFAGGVSTATTNAQGVATAPVFTANATVGGPYTVTASASGVTTSANFSLTNLTSTPVSIVLVQHTSIDAGTNTTASLAFNSSNTAGNFIAVVIRGGLSSSQVFTLSDTNGNTYKQAGQVGYNGTSVTQALYYAENIKGGANTVTVTMSVSGPLRFAILEYSGVATSSSLDAATTNTASSAAPTSGNITTTANGDLLLATIGTNGNGTYTAGTGYTIEDFVPVEPNTKMISEDQIQPAAGTTSASASIAASDIWGAVLAAFRPASGGNGPTPNITSLSQTTGAVGISITITGTNFGSTQGTSTVTFNGTLAPVSNWSATSIIVPVPSGATTGPVVVTVGGIQSNSISFTVVPAPSISGISPNSGVIGTSVTISGANFGSTQGSSSVTFNGIAGTPTSWTATSIVVPVPNGAQTGNVMVTVSGTASNGVLFTVTIPGPSISSLSLTQGPVGATFTVNGANFGSSQGSSTVTLSGTSMSTANWTPNSFNVTVPAGATSGNVIVTVGGVQSNAVPFTVTPPPAIISIAPTSGPIGTNVVITGTDFGPTVGTIQSFVTFNGTQTRASNWSDTSITAPVPAGATTGSTLVFVGGVASNGVTFTVTPPPSITSLSPTSGPAGTTVTITGANFGASQGTSTVTFNNVQATPTSWSATSIVVSVPSGATTGNVVVTESGVPSNGVLFTVTGVTGNIALVQHTNHDAGTGTSGTLAFANNTTAGNWIAVAVRGGLSSAQVFTISDSSGNTYKQAFQLGLTSTSVTFALYYAENIKGGADTITVTQSVSGPLRFAILEYSGVATSNSLDGTPVTAQGGSATPSTGNLTTTGGGDLLLAAVVSQNGDTYTAGSGYTIEETSPAAPNTKLIAEDQLQTVAGTASASATLSGSDNWGAGLAAFKSISGTALPISVSISPTSASVPSGYGTQAFTVTVQNDFKNQGVTFTLTGTGCSGSTCGALNNVTATSATFNAPTNIPNPATVTLTATSVSDPTKSASATITITQGVLSVVITPRRAGVSLSAFQTVQFTGSVFNDPANLGVTYQVDGNNGGNATTGTISATGLFTPGTQPGPHTVTAVSNANASVTASALMAVTDLVGVYTHHNDVARTGQNVQEYGLTPATVTPATFGQLFSCPVDGFVYAQPLWVANLAIGGATRNVLFVATEHDSVYAFDADSPSCVQLWKVSFLGTNVTTMGPSDLNGNTDITPEIGITSTPVIDPSTNTLYVMPKTKETAGTVSGQTCTTSAPCYVHRLHALALATGAEKFGGPVVISGTNFVPLRHLQRPALLLANGTVYIAFGSHGDQCNYNGWLMGYNASTLAQTFVDPLANSTPNNCYRGGVWQAGAGPAADANGNVYVETGNGFYDGSVSFGDSAVKISPTGSILDWFTPFNQNTLAANDIDMSSGGVTILPASVGSSAHPNLAIATGKIAILYLLDQNSMGRCSGTNNSCGSTNNDVQEVIPVPPPNTTLLDGGNYGNIAYWNGNIYTTGQNFPLSQFTIANGVIATPQSSQSSNMFPPRGGIPSVSANGITGGVVWVVDYTGWQNNTPAILDAYDATDVGTLLFTSPASGAGSAGNAVKWSVPTVANAKVYVGGQDVFTVFGLLP